MKPLSGLQHVYGPRAMYLHVNKYATLLLALLALLSLSACGAAGKAGQLQRVAFVEAPPPVSSGLPALPSNHVGPRAISAAATVLIKGNSYYQAASDTSSGIGTLDLHPAASSLAWGLYQFGATSGETVEQLSFNLTGLDAGEKCWIAISDYSKGRWSFFSPQTSASGNFDLSAEAAGRFVSPGGAIYVAVLAYDNVTFSVMDVSLRFGDRYSVSGKVLDGMGGPLEGITVRSTLGGVSAVTDANGDYSLAAVPNGSWPLVASADGYSFFATPTLVDVSGADASAPDIIGCESYSNYSSDQYEPNNFIEEAHQASQDEVLTMTLSAFQDPADYTEFQFDTAGSYAIRMRDLDGDMFFPQLSTQDINGNYLVSSSEIFQGEVLVPVLLSKPGIVRIRSSIVGGGGHYTLEVVPAPDGLRSISGQALEGGVTPRSWRPLALTGDTIDGSVRFFTGYDGPYELDFLLPGVYQITPYGDTEYNYDPGHLDADTSSASYTDLNFSLTQLVTLDSYEPNNSEGTAYDLGLVSSLTTYSPLAIGPSDTDVVDFYRFHVASGKYFEIKLNTYTNAGQLVPFSLNCYPAGAGVADTGFVTPSGMILRDGPQDALDYIIWITCPSGKSEIVPYELSIEPIDAYKVQASATLDGLPIQGARFRVTGPNCSWSFEQFTDASGLTTPFLAREGEKFMYEARRFGFNTYGQSKYITIPASDSIVTFDAQDAESDDNFEPNGGGPPTDPAFLDYPVDISATSSGNDDDDAYQFVPPAVGTYKLVCTPAPGYEKVRYYAVIGYAPDMSVAGQLETRGPRELLVNLTHHAPYLLFITSDQSFKYQLSLEATSDAFHITGTCTDESSNPLPYVNIFEPASGLSWFSDMNGSFDIGYRGAGDYVLQAYLPGYQLSAGDPYEITVHVAAADQNVPLSFGPGTADAFEPNNDWGTAYAINLSTDYSAVVGSQLSSDTDDYYYINPTPGDHVWIEVHNVVGGDLVNFTVYDSLQNPLGTGQLQDSTSRRLDFVASDPAGYYLRIVGQGDYTISSGIAP